MTVITLETLIQAPIERCFDLSRSIDLHTQSAELTTETAIAGVTAGLIGKGETVTWQGRHFGMKLTHQSQIVDFERPVFFSDRMVKGNFKSFFHEHHFESVAEATRMRDILRFEAPFSIFGRIAESVILSRYLTRFLMERNQVIKRVAESDEWREFI